MYLVYLLVQEVAPAKYVKSVQPQIEIQTFSSRRSRSPKYAEFSHFAENGQETHAQSYYSAHSAFCLVTFSFTVPS